MGGVSVQEKLGETVSPKNKKKLGCFSMFIISVGALVVIGKCAPTKKVEPISTQEYSSSITKQPLLKIERAQDDSFTLSSIDSRFKENKKHLKNYYATVSEALEGNNDFITLEGITRNYKHDETKEGKSLYKKSIILLAGVDNQRREMFASALEEGFMKDGLNITVKAVGGGQKTLRIKFSLMSQPLVYKFQNELKVSDNAKSAGFSKIIYTNGFESSLGDTWTIKL